MYCIPVFPIISDTDNIQISQVGTIVQLSNEFTEIVHNAILELFGKMWIKRI